MKLKEYIAILSTLDQEAEVLKYVHNRHHKSQRLVEVEKHDIIVPYMHFKYVPKTGREVLVNSFILNPR